MKPLKDLFNAEVFLFDDTISSKAYELHEQGLTDNQIKIIINENN
jgi:5-bromo-4-chloroindolyl phosphate hydrolysis protein